MFNVSVFNVSVFKAALLTQAFLLSAAASPAAAEEGWVASRGADACHWMDMHPNLYGALSTMKTMEHEGVPRPQVPGVLAAVITTYCPQHVGLFNQVKDYLTHMGNPGIVGVG